MIIISCFYIYIYFYICLTADLSVSQICCGYNITPDLVPSLPFLILSLSPFLSFLTFLFLSQFSLFSHSLPFPLSLSRPPCSVSSIFCIKISPVAVEIGRHYATSRDPSLHLSSSLSLSPLASSHFLPPFAWRWIYARPIDSVGSSPTSGRLVGGSVFRCRSGRVIFGRFELRADANGRAGGRASRPLVRRRGGWWWAWVVGVGRACGNFVVGGGGVLFLLLFFFMSIYLLIIWWSVYLFSLI